MGHTRYEPTFDNRPAWNVGRMEGAKKPLKPRDVWAIRFFLEHEGRLRDRAMFDLAIDSKLRGCDVIKITIGDAVADYFISPPWLDRASPDRRLSWRHHKLVARGSPKAATTAPLRATGLCR